MKLTTRTIFKRTVYALLLPNVNQRNPLLAISEKYEENVSVFMTIISFE